MLRILTFVAIILLFLLFIPLKANGQTMEEIDALSKPPQIKEICEKVAVGEGEYYADKEQLGIKFSVPKGPTLKIGDQKIELYPSGVENIALNKNALPTTVTPKCQSIPLPIPGLGGITLNWECIFGGVKNTDIQKISGKPNLPDEIDDVDIDFKFKFHETGETPEEIPCPETTAQVDMKIENKTQNRTQTSKDACIIDIVAPHDPPAVNDPVYANISKLPALKEFNLELEGNGQTKSSQFFSNKDGFLGVAASDKIDTMGSYLFGVKDFAGTVKCSKAFQVVEKADTPPLICSKDDKSGVTCTRGAGLSCPPDGRSAGIQTAIGCIHTKPAELIKDIMTFLLGSGGGLAFLMMVFGAFQMMTSSGNPETLNAGRSRLTSAVIGLLFIIFAVLFLQIIGVDILNLPGFER